MSTEPLRRAREHRTSLRAAMGEVESALATPASGREEPWRRALAAQLAALGTAFEGHIAATEGDDGLLAEILATAPRLAHRIERAERDHVRLRTALGEASAAVEAGADVVALRDQAVALLTDLIRHRQLGADLVYETYNVDLEAGD